MRMEQRRRCISARQRAHLVERFQSSGLARIAFARRYGVGLSTLGKCFSKARAASPRPSSAVYREVHLAGGGLGSRSRLAIEVVSRDGLTVRCREALSVQDLAALLRGLAR